MLHEAVEHFEQLPHVLEVQAGGRLVEDVERLPGAAADEFLRQLDALRLAAGERGRRLAELDVVEAHVVQRLHHRANFRDVLEVFERLRDLHFQHVLDRLAAVLHLERFAVEPAALAHRALHPHVGEEVHCELVRTVPLARLAPPAGLVEAEPARLVTPHLRVRHLRVQRADFVPQFDVRRRVRARRAADRRLVDVDHFVDVFGTFDARPFVAIEDFTRVLFVAILFFHRGLTPPAQSDG